MFERSESAFFHQERTRRSLLQLASAERLTIYCGAGVTIDRTGYGWGGLISSVFAPDSSAHASYPTSDEMDLLQKFEDPLRLASILTGYAENNHPTPSELKSYITPILQNRLYRTRTWQAGRLTRTVCGVAIAAAMLGVEVDIVTANYDTYLESAFDVAVARFAASAVGEQLRPAVPELRTFVYEGAVPDPREIAFKGTSALAAEFLGADNIHGQLAPPTVNLHYIHGRVDATGEAQGDLVISEIDYASSRHRTEGVLGRYVTPDRALLVLGASLTDPPLINALADSVPNSEIENFQRFALMPRSSFEFARHDEPINSRLVSHMAKRAELLGLKLLVPDFRVQVAQFCQELSSCIESEDAELFLSEEKRYRYGLRLNDWWTNWEKSDFASEPFSLYDKLVEHMDVISRHIQGAAGPNYRGKESSESFRLEIWVREKPDSRVLTLWGNTTGPLVDPGARRRSEIRSYAANASVAALTEGRPQHFDSSELGQGSDLSRWRSFLAVPYFASTSVGRIPVGVLTLASTASREDSVLPLANVTHMETLRDLMIHCGSLILEEGAPQLADA